jgi:hypothetical protein
VVCVVWDMGAGLGRLAGVGRKSGEQCHFCRPLSMAKRACRKRKAEKDQAMERRDDSRETANSFFDASPASENERNVDTTPRANDAVRDARASANQGRIMVIGFQIIRV